MDVSFDRFGELGSGLTARFDTAADAAATSGPLDWHGLAARLAAAHAARQVLCLPPRRCGPECGGSFAPDTARDLARWRAIGDQPARCLPGVNRDAKADGKPWWPIVANGAGDDRSIVRRRL